MTAKVKTGLANLTKGFETVKPATLNPYRRNAGALLVEQLANGAEATVATVHAVASQCMKNATPGPMAIRAVLDSAAIALRDGIAYDGKLKHVDWSADAVVALPAKAAKAKAISKAKRKLGAKK